MDIQTAQKLVAACIAETIEVISAVRSILEWGEEEPRNKLQLQLLNLAVEHLNEMDCRIETGAKVARGEFEDA